MILGRYQGGFQSFHSRMSWYLGYLKLVLVGETAGFPPGKVAFSRQASLQDMKLQLGLDDVCKVLGALARRIQLVPSGKQTVCY